jgi:hypothetical protein
MTDTSRLEVRLSAGLRRELAELAAETGIRSSNLARLAIKRLLAHPGELLNPLTDWVVERSQESERAAGA